MGLEEALAVRQLLPIFLGLAFVATAYLIVTIDRSRANSPSKDDTQVGIKLVLYGLVLVGIALAAQGAIALLSYILGGFKGGTVPIRLAMPPIIVGGLVVLALAKALLPRTNAASQRQVERYALGVLGITFGGVAIFALYQLISGLFLEASWSQMSGSLAMLAVTGAIAFLSISRLGAVSGWTMPVAAPPPPQYPPQGGYPQQGGGYPPPGGGYPPPQGGGYPPPQGGGGYPPQGGGGGGYAPPGGGYPPPQGGGGGGYPPR